MNQDLPVTFDEDGLVPVVVQDVDSGDVLMMAFMNSDALEATRQTGRSHFWSRSRQKLWRKGETSGHEQLVDEILINCEQNSLLLKVHQLGAVCHDGYNTCYYRSLEPDNRLRIQREQVFDPATVYGSNASFESVAREWFAAYEYLGQNDLTHFSQTSKLLHDTTFDPRSRIADELNELAGVLDGTHRHNTQSEDIILEGTQVLYWVILAALIAGVKWNNLRPDRALETSNPGINLSLVAKMLRRNADQWRADAASGSLTLHETIALVSQAARSVEIEPIDLIRADLADLRTKPYLSPYFENATTDFSRTKVLGL